MFYAGIGSRTTPDDIIQIMTKVAKRLATMNYTLRSGGAAGADTAFENGAGRLKQIFRPRDATAEAIRLASEFHPAWHNCNEYVRKLHGRNAQIILGRELDEPVEFVLCWTPGGQGVGGTGMGISIAESRNVPVKNLFDSLVLKEVQDTYL